MTVCSVRCPSRFRGSISKGGDQTARLYTWIARYASNNGLVAPRTSSFACAMSRRRRIDDKPRPWRHDFKGFSNPRRTRWSSSEATAASSSSTPPQTERLFGYPRAELLGQRVDVLVPERFRGEHPGHRDTYFRGPKVLGRWARGWSSTASARTARSFRSRSASAPSRREEGLLVSSAIRDVTERRGREEALRASEERFRMLLDGANDYAVLFLDVDGNVVSWTDGAERVKGYRASEIIGRHFSVFYPPEDVDHGKPLTELGVAASDGRFVDEGWRVRKDGTRFWASVVITALRDGGGRLRGFGKVTRDMSEWKRIQDALRASEEQLRRKNDEIVEQYRRVQEATRLKSEFLANMSHELRTPLNAIIGFTELLHNGKVSPESPEHNEYLGDVLTSARHLLQLIDDVLDLSKIEAGSWRSIRSR